MKNNKYLIILEKYWNKYGNNAYIDRVCYDLEEAEYVRESLERNDRMNFVIVKDGRRIK